MKKYTVWVGGVEVNDYYLTQEEAEKLAQEYKNDGYDDVIIEGMKNMKKLYRKLTKEQRERGVYFSSTLSNYRTETESDKVHEITHAEYNENPSEAEAKEARLRDSKFFNGLYKYNIIRS